MIPYVIEQTYRGERTYDLYSRLLKDRVIFLGDGIDSQVANILIAQLLFLEASNSEADIYFYINSPGGSVNSGLAIYDTMQFIRPAVQTICIGQASSIAAVLLAAGEKGKRVALKHASLLLHQPIGNIGGQATDIQIQTAEIKRIKGTLVDIFAKHTGQSKAKVSKDSERECFLTSQQAVEYGVVDKVMVKAK